jgi:hypothetical protein
MKITHYISIIAILFFSLSCEKDIEFNGDITDNKIVMNSYITPDSVISVHLSKSKFFLNSGNNFVLVKNAKIDLYVNNVLKEQLSHDQDGWYKGTYKPKENDVIELIAKVPTYEDVKTKTQVPQKAVIVKIDTTFIAGASNSVFSGGDVLGENVSGKLLINIIIKDNPDRKDYYRISMKTFNLNDTTNARMNEWNTYFSLQGYNVKGDNIFDLLEGDLGGSKSDNFHLINDDLFNGNEIKFTIEQQVSYFRSKPGEINPKEWSYGGGIPNYEINIQSITRDMFLFIQTKKANQDSFTDFFSEPVVIFNNIENGIGILGSYVDSKTEIRLK